jgi:hypothetical protein
VSAAPYGRGSAAGTRNATPRVTPGGDGGGLAAGPHPAAAIATAATPAAIRSLSLMSDQTAGDPGPLHRPAGFLAGRAG